MRVLVPFLCVVLISSCCVHPSMSEERAGETFTSLTGIVWKDDFEMVGYKDEHVGIADEGEFAVVVAVPEDELSRILGDAPPWGEVWQHGPVDGQIGFHCSFIYTDSPSASCSGDSTRYLGGSPEVVELLSSPDVMWSARHMGPESMPWHNGDLLVVDQVSSTIWFSSWDF